MVCPNCQHANREGAKFCEECGFALAGAPALETEQRRTVTVVFCDLAGSTALGESVDPERLRALLARYFERMKEIVERHGGTVEKFIGDAVMAVFGVPVTHEDDALRAVRAAAEMRDALPELGLSGRIGVTTGEVVTGTEERLATGDAVNVAARLEQAAPPGEVLIGEPTLELVREAVKAEAVEPLLLKGKAEPVPAHRLLAVGDAPERRHDTKFVGREPELALLRDAWERAVGEERCELVTVVGEAGVGKSRLVEEALGVVEATIVRGRCPPYGEGITYWPVVEVLKQLREPPPEEAAASAIRSLLREEATTSSPEEIAWAFRKTLEHAAAQAPLIVVFDDIQWGEETFRDLIEHVALLAAGVPLLLLCMARPELVERRPSWPVTLTLEPLGDEAVDELIPQQVAGELRGRIASASGGNPLFIEEMLAMTAESHGDVTVPPTLQALLASRLDQLEPAERGVLERGSIEGEIFHRGAVQALAREGSQITPHLAALVRKQVIRPEWAQLAGEDGFRFRHLLIRDAAYEALPKATRADLHERFAGWLEHSARDFVELDEILGYHLEQACRYRSEVGMPEDPALATAARRRLTAGGQRACRRQDYAAAASLFERAVALVPPNEVDLALESELADVLIWTGRLDDALQRSEALGERASTVGDSLGELCARIEATRIRATVEPDSIGDLAVLLEQALPLMEAADDPMALYIGYYAQGDVEDARGHSDAALEAFERAYAHAERAGYRPSPMLATLAYLRFAGTTPVSGLLAWLDENDESGGSNQFVRAFRGWSLAKLGRFDEARAIIAEARAVQAERGPGPLLANLTAFESVAVELLAGDPAAAVAFAEEGCRQHEELGTEYFLAQAHASLAQALYELGRLEDAETSIDRTAELASSEDMTPAVLVPQLRAKLLAHKGETAAAIRLGREATTLADATDAIERQGAAYADLAEVLLLGGKPDEAAAALEQALDRFERKGNLVSAGRVRARLAELHDAAPR